MAQRRTILKAIAGTFPLSLLGGNSVRADEVASSPERDFYQELGVKKVLNAAGAYSALGGARMRPEVIDAMRYAATHKVKMTELHDAVGMRIASLVGSDSAMVTSGATASIVLGTAACMTLGDEDKMRQLPDTSGIRNEIIIQKKHRYTYDRALTVAGGKLIEVESEEEVRRVVNDRTAMMFFLKPTSKGDDIAAGRYVRLARHLGVPSFCDAATTTPPASNVVDGVSENFDLICYSGGKGLRGPYSAGLLLGRTDLVAYARRHAAPSDISIGRGMKVSAEEYLGMLVAVEVGLNTDDETDSSYKYARFTNIVAQISDIPGVTTNVFTAAGHAKEIYLDIDWDEGLINLSRQDFVNELRDHTPSVVVRLLFFSGGRIQLSATIMEEGQDVIVGRIIRSVLLRHV